MVPQSCEVKVWISLDHRAAIGVVEFYQDQEKPSSRGSMQNFPPIALLARNEEMEYVSIIAAPSIHDDMELQIPVQLVLLCVLPWNGSGKAPTKAR
mmetsp:Transcript_3677/g.23051  ORF Transcript_3677/g.23051 Transcript_3677/m.23051 type:complete len:96 (-) Transcript_3677:2116-2403(-)